MNRIKVSVQASCEGSPMELYSIQAITEDGRRYWYCYPDGKMHHGRYLRELTEIQYIRLLDAIRAAGGIDTTKPCWQEGDPVYGSLAYELSGTELQWAERERAEANW